MLNPDYTDLVLSILNFDLKKRIRLSKILVHPWTTTNSKSPTTPPQERQLGNAGASCADSDKLIDLPTPADSITSA